MPREPVPQPFPPLVRRSPAPPVHRPTGLADWLLRPGDPQRLCPPRPAAGLADPGDCAGGLSVGRPQPTGPPEAASLLGKRRTVGAAAGHGLLGCLPPAGKPRLPGRVPPLALPPAGRRHLRLCPSVLAGIKPYNLLFSSLLPKPYKIFLLFFDFSLTSTKNRV